MKKDLPRGFNWLTELTGLSEGKKIGNDRKIELDSMAGQWPTCACGQLCDLLERHGDGSPVDHRLKTLGVRFSEHVSAYKWCLALETFKKIECRTTELLEDKGVL